MKRSIRTDKWEIEISQQKRQWMKDTIAEYRLFCKALSIVVINNWPELQKAESFCATVERLIHPTAKNPSPRHNYFHKRFYKFPSYLRRAAIEYVQGQVSSYLSRYGKWLDGERRHPHEKPPLFNANAGCYPALYKNQLIKYAEDFSYAQIKVRKHNDWVWIKVKIKSKRQRHLIGELRSPMLIVTNKQQHLSVPIRVSHPKRKTGLACSVDMGINTTATMAIVDQHGTVHARMFFHPSKEIDRRDKSLRAVSKAARKTKQLSKGFCKQRYRKAQQYNRQIAQITSRAIVNFAVKHGADTVVLENLKGWKPRAGKKRSKLKAKFHSWLKSAVADLTQMKFEEIGGRIFKVFARGTSSEAYDGSGPVQRNKKQYEIATFSTGKIYNADLNAAYNIAARFWAIILKLTHGNSGQWLKGKSSLNQQRIPVTLSTLWGRGAGSRFSCVA
ncbi:IS200/IS605 family accessory protein TnpB-related protein [Neptuniibacter sp. QD37_11]|uniref:IS200/IS605 family accessory protein TnpB-related protein n=1 Tax=Neptuniibacter sp. QD37_11 TaxID=3398209 RepID=UPI0039F52876